MISVILEPHLGLWSTEEGTLPSCEGHFPGMCGIPVRPDAGEAASPMSCEETVFRTSELEETLKMIWPPSLGRGLHTGPVQRPVWAAGHPGPERQTVKEGRVTLASFMQ